MGKLDEAFLQNYDNLILASSSNTTPTFLESEQVYPHPYLGLYLSLSKKNYEVWIVFHTYFSDYLKCYVSNYTVQAILLMLVDLL